jgi:hypothetical protein
VAALTQQVAAAATSAHPPATPPRAPSASEAATPSTPALLASPGPDAALSLVDLNNRLRAALTAARDRMAADRATAAAL